MSAKPRLGRALSAVVLGRLLVAAPLALVVQAWSLGAIRHQPDGELALFAHGSLLLAERVVVAGPPLALRPLALALALAQIVASLLTHGALVLVLARARRSVRAALGGALARLGRALLVTGAQALFFALVGVCAALTAPTLPVVTAIVALGLALAASVIGDAVRARAVLCDEGLGQSAAVAVRSVSGRLLRELARVAGARLVELLLAIVAVALPLYTVARSAGAFAGACGLALACLFGMAWARAWFLGGLVRVVTLDADDPLHRGVRLGYDSDPSSEAPR